MQTENTERKHREKTQRENTHRKHREKTQRENADRSATQYYKALHNTFPYCKAPRATTLYYKVLHSTPRRSRESSPGPSASKANALSARQIFWDDRARKIAIANTMRGAIAQIQNTNVHAPRPMRGAIPRAQNLRFATVSHDRPTESYERGFIRQNPNVRFATAACHPKCQNARFATAACTKVYEMSTWRRQSPAA